MAHTPRYMVCTVAVLVPHVVVQWANLIKLRCTISLSTGIAGHRPRSHRRPSFRSRGRQAGRQLGIQRMRGLSTTGHFYGHSNAHKTLDVLPGWCWLCVWVCRGLFGQVSECESYLRVFFTGCAALLLLLQPLLSDAKLLIKLYDNLLNQCFPSPLATFSSSCPTSLRHTLHTRLPQHNGGVIKNSIFIIQIRQLIAYVTRQIHTERYLCQAGAYF